MVVVLSDGSEIWALNIKRRLNAVEMDYLRRSARISKPERKMNEEVRNKMNARETVVDIIEKIFLKLFGHLIRMPDERDLRMSISEML